MLYLTGLSTKRSMIMSKGKDSKNEKKGMKKPAKKEGK